MNKIIIRYVGGSIGEPGKGEIFGGTKTTNYIIKKAFGESEMFDLQLKTRNDFKSIEEVKEFLDGGELTWLDDSGMLNDYYSAGYERPDLIGPITRSPIKRYNRGEWRAEYTPKYFYSGKLIRLNESEEKPSTMLEEFSGDYIQRIDFIKHGVDTNISQSQNNKYVLWAGSVNRPAKNYPMWLEIQEEIKKLGGLPEGVEFKTMSSYAIEDYWDTLNDTAILVNTSKYESFCCAVAESMAKGVYSVVRKNFNGQIMFLDRPGQVEYTAKAYAKEILRALPHANELGKQARQYAEENFSLKSMRQDIEKVFMEILNERN